MHSADCRRAPACRPLLLLVCLGPCRAAIARLEEENEQFLSTYHQEVQQLGQVGPRSLAGLLLLRFCCVWGWPSSASPVAA